MSHLKRKTYKVKRRPYRFFSALVNSNVLNSTQLPKKLCTIFWVTVLSFYIYTSNIPSVTNF